MFCGEEIDVDKYYDNDKKGFSMDSLDFLHQHVIAVLKQYSRIKPEHVSMLNLLEIYSSYYDIDDYVHDVVKVLFPINTVQELDLLVNEYCTNKDDIDCDGIPIIMSCNNLVLPVNFDGYNWDGVEIDVSYVSVLNTEIFDSAYIDKGADIISLRQDTFNTLLKHQDDSSHFGLEVDCEYL